MLAALLASLALAHGPVLTGVNAQAEPADFRAVATLHARLVRLHIDPDEAGARWLRATARSYAVAGARIQPVVTFDGRMITPGEVRELVALDRIPGLRDVELGNETSYGYQYHDGHEAASYRQRARLYAQRVREAALLLGPHGIGVLAQAEDGGSGSAVWVQEMFASVPGLSRYVAGWTIHPYPDQRSAAAADTYGIPKMRRMVADLAAEGDTTTPIDITEWGVPSDDGAALSDGTRFTYAQAAEVLRSTIPKLVAAAGRHPIASLLLYQVRDQRRRGTSRDFEDYFGALTRTDGSKGAYTAAVRLLMRE